MKKFALILIVVTGFMSSHAQENVKTFFDVSGKKTTESGAYYYRILDSVPNLYKSYYISGKLFFEGAIRTADALDESKNKYIGTCIWYYKNGKKKIRKTFNSDGTEEGISTYYFESDKIWKELEYKSGVIVDGKYREYNEKGDITWVFEDGFDNNMNDWDLYSNKTSSAQIKNGFLELNAFTKEGTSRLINLPIKSEDYIIETTFDQDDYYASRVELGFIWGFKDWQNYNYMTILGNSVYLGSVYEGVQLIKVDGMYSGDLFKKGANTLKLFVSDGKLIVTINGVLQTKTPELKMEGNQFGYIIKGSSNMKVDNLIIKEFKGQNSGVISSSDLSVRATGSGIILSKNGYIATNYHVVADYNKIIVDVTINGEVKSYEATVVQKDEQNDLAIIKITDEAFNMNEVNYSFAETGTLAVGASVFTIGYPYALSGMGKEVKFTDGKISAKTGYNNAINSFQSSIPVQPGNSGGPVFNEQGQLIGLINSKFATGDNVSYAIKLNFLKNIFELLPDVPLPSDKKIESLPIEEKVKVLSKYVVLIKIK